MKYFVIILRAIPLAYGGCVRYIAHMGSPGWAGALGGGESMTEIAKLKSAAAHAKLSHSYWLGNARRGGIGGRYGRAYCLEGAAIWRRRLAEILADLRALKAEAAR
jgi:hypothetical protein